MTNKLAVTLGKELKRLRIEKGYTQEELANKLKLHRTYISAVELGKKNITINNVYKFACELDTNLYEIFNTIKL